MVVTFACQYCTAAPEPIPDSNLVVVRHAPGCLTLQAQVRARWPGEPAGLPDTLRQIPFEQRAAFGRWHKAVLAREQRRQARR